ncbi:MAG: hypothetical protein J0L92_35520 [Deltaproteobacteria bacterium]|nr:hypothetical protein [Deltaproteobacteria bacterium]
MLEASSTYEGFGARIATSIAIAPGVLAHLVTREGLVVDTRALASMRVSMDVVTLYALLEGRAEVEGGGVHDAPVAVLLREDELDLRARDARWLRVTGARSVSLELRIASAWLRRPAGLDAGPLSLSPRTIATARALSHGALAPLSDLLASLEEDGVVEGAARASLDVALPASLTRTWSLLAKAYAGQSTGIDHVRLAGLATFSPRTLQRDLETLMAWGRLDGFRGTVRCMRLRRAAVLLSARDATVREVARVVGYGSEDALGRAFRDAGLPSPSEVRTLTRVSVR